MWNHEACRRGLVGIWEGAQTFRNDAFVGLDLFPPQASPPRLAIQCSSEYET